MSATYQLITMDKFPDLTLEQQFRLSCSLLALENSSKEEILELTKTLVLLTERQQLVIKWLIKQLLNQTS